MSEEPTQVSNSRLSGRGFAFGDEGGVNVMKRELCSHYNRIHYLPKEPLREPLAIGTGVFIRSDLVDDRVYGSDTFVSEMRKYCGEKAYIREYREHRDRGIRYVLTVDGGFWNWSREMLLIEVDQEEDDR